MRRFTLEPTTPSVSSSKVGKWVVPTVEDQAGVEKVGKWTIPIDAQPQQSGLEVTPIYDYTDYKSPDVFDTEISNEELVTLDREQQQLQQDLDRTGRTEAEAVLDYRQGKALESQQATQQRLEDIGQVGRMGTSPQIPIAETPEQAALQQGFMSSFGADDKVGLLGQLSEETISEKDYVRPSGVAQLPESGFLGTAQPQRFEYSERKAQPFSVGASKVAGQLVGTAAQYAMVSKAIAPLTAKLGLEGAKKFAVTQAADLLVDNIVQLPREIIKAVQNDQSMAQDAKNIAFRNLIDVAYNLAVGGAGDMLKKVIKSGDSNVENLVKEGYNKSIQEELGLPKEMTAQEFVDSMKQISDDIEIDQYYKQFETDINPTEIPQVFDTTVKEEVPEVFKVEPSKVEELPEVFNIDRTGTMKQSKFNETLIKSDDTVTEIKNRIKENPRMYEATTNQEQIEIARQMIKENPQAMEDLVLGELKVKEMPTDIELVAGKILFEDLQNAGKFDKSMRVLEAIGKKYTKTAQALQTASLWSKSTPIGMQKWANKTLNEVGITPSEDLMKSVKEEMTQISKMPDGYEKDFATAVLQRRVLGEIPSSMWQKVSTFQAMSHLLNAKTMLRNILGNSAFAGAEGISNLIATPFDALAATKTGKRTVKTGGFPRFMKNLEAGFEAAKRANREINFDVDVSGAQKFSQFKGRTFKKGILGQAEKALSKGLKVPDEFFKDFRKASSLYQQVFDRVGKDADKMSLEELVKKATPKEIAQAEQEALYATFQDNSLPAQILQTAKDGANKIGFGKRIRGASGTSTKEFGLGDLVVKYTRVPGNIISRGVEYSPLGYLKFIDAVKNGKGQREAVLDMARATTGTGLIATSMYLADNGVLLGEDKDGSYNRKALERSEGLGNYKINVSALDRLINGESTEPKKGDQLESYNWLQPVSTSMAIGAALSNERKKQDSDLGSFVGNVSGEMVDIPSLMVINQMFYEAAREDSTPFTIASVPLVQSASGFVPALVRQTAQYLDPVARETRPSVEAESMGRIGEQALNKLKAATPIIRETLEPRISPLGEPVEYNGGVIPSYIKPSIGTTYEPTKISEELNKISERTGEETAYPSRQAPSYVTVNKERINLTPEMKTAYQEKAGQTIEREYNKILEKTNVDNMTTSQVNALVKTLEKIKKESRQDGKFEVLKMIRKQER